MPDARTITLSHPLGASASVVLTSPFGYRVVQGVHGDKRHMHNGADFAAVWPLKTEGLPVHAAAAGRVDRRGTDKVNGNYVGVDHGDGWRTMYLHLQAPASVRQGQTVVRGQAIGRAGNTGVSTAAHLHFMLYRDGTPVDPVPYIRRDDAALLARTPARTLQTAQAAARGAARYWWAFGAAGLGVILLTQIIARRRS